MKEINFKLKEIRLKKGLYQEELAQQLNITQQRISEYERGLVFPKLDRLVDIALLLDVTLDELIEFKLIHNKLSKDLKNIK